MRATQAAVRCVHVAFLLLAAATEAQDSRVRLAQVDKRWRANNGQVQVTIGKRQSYDKTSEIFSYRLHNLTKEAIEVKVVAGPSHTAVGENGDTWKLQPDKGFGRPFGVMKGQSLNLTVEWRPATW